MRRQRYVLSPPPNATAAADNNEGVIASGGLNIHRRQGKFSGVSGAPTAASTPANDHSDHAVVLSYEGKVSSANDHSAVGIGGDK